VKNCSSSARFSTVYPKSAPSSSLCASAVPACVCFAFFLLLSWSLFGAFFSFFCFCGGAFSFLFLVALPILGRNGGGGL
jgi:hypothetical protein